MGLTVFSDIDGLHGGFDLDLATGRAGEDLEELPEATADGGVASRQLKGVVLIPVKERQVLQLGRVGKLQIGQVPVHKVALRSRQIDVSTKGRNTGIL